MHIGEKIRKLREEELEMGRAEFCEITGIPKQTLIKIEQGQTDPRVSTLLKITEKYPDYASWLVSGKADIRARQTRPKK